MRNLTSCFVATGAWLLALGVCSSGCRDVQPRHEVAAEVVALGTAIADIEAGRTTTPLIATSGGDADATVTFLAKRDGARVPRIVSDVTGWGEHIDGTFDSTVGTMTRVGQTEWYSLRARVASRARIEYLIAYGAADHRPDPHNPRRSAGPELGGLPASEFTTPGYVPPLEFAGPRAPSGTSTEVIVQSRVLRGPHRLIIHTPPGYRGDGGYPVAVFLDLRAVHVARVIDSLVARRAIAPIVAVFVGPAGGTAHPTGAAMRSFVAEELPEWLASRYAVSRSPDERAILGISFGAKDALDAAVASRSASGAPRSGVPRRGGFGLVGLLVPGRRIGPADLAAIGAPRSHRLRVAILAGQYDRANVATARSVRRALADAGDTVDYEEVPEGHSAVTWLHHLGRVLVGLFGTRSAGESTAPDVGERGLLPAPAIVTRPTIANMNDARADTAPGIPVPPSTPI